MSINQLQVDKTIYIITRHLSFHFAFKNSLSCNADSHKTRTLIFLFPLSWIYFTSRNTRSHWIKFLNDVMCLFFSLCCSESFLFVLHRNVCVLLRTWPDKCSSAIFWFHKQSNLICIKERPSLSLILQLLKRNRKFSSS